MPSKVESKDNNKPAVKRIDMSKNKFTANGKTYYIQEDMTVTRYVEFLKQGNEISFQVDFEHMYATLNKIWEAASSGNDLIQAIANIRELAYNQISAIVDFHKTEHPSILRFCTLFINADNEDLTRYDEPLIDQKIEDWTIEGIEIADFFLLAANFNPGFKKAFQKENEIASLKKKKKEALGGSTTGKTSKQNSRGGSLAREATRNQDS